jgi:alpha-L-rhamnosidase
MVLCDGNGKLKKEFQTAYVLPLHFGMFPDGQRENAVKNLVALIERNNYRIGTGFPGTPYILFALADNGYTDVAYKMLTCELCPSWLYEVKVGATTIWERWDALDENGVCTIGDDGTGGMISFNHYAFGAVGDFLYRRIAGIEAETGGYQTFRIQPIVGEGIDFAKGEVNTPFGKVCSEWKTKNETFTLQISVPVSTTCRVVMPSGQEYLVGSGKYSYCESLKKERKRYENGK